MFAGLSAFPLTPMDECGIDEAAFVGLVARLAQSFGAGRLTGERFAAGTGDANACLTARRCTP